MSPTLHIEDRQDDESLEFGGGEFGRLDLKATSTTNAGIAVERGMTVRLTTSPKGSSLREDFSNALALRAESKAVALDQPPTGDAKAAKVTVLEARHRE